MLSREPLRAALDSANLRAFLRVIRAGETNQTPDAYRMIFGGDLVDSLADHPRRKVTRPLGGKPITSTAAGAYQFLERTWDGLVKQYGFPDFEPATQDFAAVALIKGRGALEDAIAGRLEAAIRKCAKEWASLPFSPYGQPTKTLEQCRAVYLNFGGTLADAATQSVKPIKEATMALPILAILSAFGPVIAQLIPQIAKAVDPQPSERAQLNVAAAQTIIDTIVRASGQTNIQSAVEVMQTDATVKEQVTQAVVTEPTIIGLLEFGGGVQAAREAGIVMQNAERPFWFNPVFWMSLILLPLVYWIVGSVLVGGVELPENAPWWAHAAFKLFGNAFTAEMRAGIANIVLGMVLGGIVGIWFGTSYGSMKKDDTINQATKGK